MGNGFTGQKTVSKYTETTR